MSIDLTGIEHHPAVEEIVDVLCNKIQTTDRGFFRTEVAYFLGKIASCMRATIVTKDRGEIPVSIYALALATSGFGKGYSVNVMENEFMKPFQRRFMEDTLPVISEMNLHAIAAERAVRKVTEEEKEFEKVEKEYRRAGAYPFTFDSATPPAVKQLRHKLLLANAGSINLQIDEIGSNLLANADTLNLFLELYDQGMVKQKLTKNTAENERVEEIDGKTPTNMLLFGTPSKLFDGGQTEDQFYSFLDTGYARRCIFGYGQHDRKAFNTMTPEDIYARLTQPTNDKVIQKWATQFHRLADAGFFGWKMTVDEDVGIALLRYKFECEKIADGMADHQEINKAEISHRYFKALKLAGAYAFVDESSEIDMDHLTSAILLVEESGAAFQAILKREKTYVKLAKYIAAIQDEVTHADLLEALPFYKQGNAARNEQMSLATAWGYKHHIVIKKRFIDGIEFFKGETLAKTDLSKIMISYSDHFAYHYQHEEVPFDQLHLMTQAEGYHWTNHAFRNGHRAEENVVPGFNLIVIDVDGGASLETVHALMNEYKFMTYTTKRHTEAENRFRLIIPTNYVLELDHDDYKEFMNEFMAWLPFKTDEGANQRARKWMSHDGEYYYNPEGDFIDVLPFIPKTAMSENYRKNNSKLENLDNLERWFAQRMSEGGGRNNNMIKYALALVDNGMDLMTVQNQVLAFNKKLSEPLPESEISSTVLTTVAKRFQRS